jgi:hypothetical protein
MRRILGTLSLMLIFALASSLFASAQTGATESLSGAVTDAQGAAVSGATVVVKNSATNAEFKATTSEKGDFNVASLPAGTYTVTVTAPGFKQAVVGDVKVETGQSASVKVVLEKEG